MTALIAKEFRQSWRSFRLPALLLVLLFMSIMDPLATKYMGELLERFAKGIIIVTPPPTSAQAMSQFLGDVLELGILVVIGITMGTVAGEKPSGVTSFIVTRPASRLAYAASKLIVLLTGLTVGIAGATLIASSYAATLIGPLDAGPTALAAVSVWLYAAFILCATFSASMAANGPLAAGGAGFAAFLTSALAGSLLGSTSIGEYLPYALVANIEIFLKGSEDAAIASRILRPALTSTVLSLAFLALGFRSFRRQDLP